MENALFLWKFHWWFLSLSQNSATIIDKDIILLANRLSNEDERMSKRYRRCGLAFLLAIILVFNTTEVVKAQDMAALADGEVLESDQEDQDNPNDPDDPDNQENPDDPSEETLAVPSLAYRTHVVKKGWTSWEKNGNRSGNVSGKNSLDALKISLGANEYEGTIQYRSYSKASGWQGWKTSGALSGTTSKMRALEALQIRLTGELAEKFSVYYRVYSKGYGWMGWTFDGAKAGTSVYPSWIQAVQIRIVPKSEKGPSGTGRAFRTPKIVYKAYGKKYKWQKQTYDGRTAGTAKKNLQMKGMKIRLQGVSYSGSIVYRTFLTKSGWQGWKSDGALTGKTAKSTQMEAVCIKLRGEIANHYDVYYRVRVKTVGWLSWTKNGKPAGTRNLGKYIEGVQIKLISKKAAKKPDTTGRAFFRRYQENEVSFTGYVKGVGRVTKKGNGKVLGTKKNALDGFAITLDKSSGEVSTGNVSYRAYVQGKGWTGWQMKGALAGTKGKKRMETVQIKLTGTLDKLYDVYYRANVQSYGWLGWTKNGGSAGTTGINYRIEALQIKLVPKNVKGPKISADCLKGVVNVPEQKGSALKSFGGYKMSAATKKRLNAAIGNFTGRGHRVGFYMIDLMTGKGVYYNSNGSFYSASSIKGPYVVSLNEKVPTSVSHSSGTMRQTIKVSSNEGYASLRRAYGMAPFKRWLSDAGVKNINYWSYYISITPRKLAQMWAKNYEFFYSGRPNSVYCRSLFTGTLNSPISNTMGRKYTVYSKAGWIGQGGYYNVQNDGGIVMRKDHPYVVVILSTAYGHLSSMNTLVSAIDAAHEELIKQ